MVYRLYWIGVCSDCPMLARHVEQKEGYVAVVRKGITFLEFEDYLNLLEDSQSKRRGEKCIIASDFMLNLENGT